LIVNTKASFSMTDLSHSLAHGEIDMA